MQVTLLKTPDDRSGDGFELEFPKENGTMKADIVSRGRKSKALERLSRAPWTRKHAYGYVRGSRGKLWQIVDLEFDEGLSKVKSLQLIAIGYR